MNEYNEHNASEKLTKMLDGELDPSLEAELQSEIDSNPDLEMEMRDQLTIRNAIREDKEKLVPSISTTKSVFAAAGITALTSGVASSPSFISTVFGTAGKIITAAILTAFVAVVGYFSVADNDNKTSDSVTEIITKNESDLIIDDNKKENSTKEIKDELLQEDQKLSINIINNSSKEIKATIGNTETVNNYDQNQSDPTNYIAEKYEADQDLLNNTNYEDIALFSFNEADIYDNFNLEDSFESNNYGFNLKNNKYKDSFFKKSLFNMNINAVNNPFFGLGYSGSLELNISKVSTQLSRVISTASFEFSQFRGDDPQNLIALNLRISPDMKLISCSNGGNFRPILELKAGQFESFTVGGAIGLEMNTMFEDSYLQVRFNNLNTNYISVGLRKSF